MKISRRSFIRSVATAGAVSLFVLLSRVWGADKGPNGLLTMGFIGMGKQNRGLLNNFLHRDVKVLAVCDVDTSRRDSAVEMVKKVGISAVGLKSLKNAQLGRRQL